jgi:hypothetical protein
MTDPAVTAKQLVDLATKHIEDQQNRIVRQRELMAMRRPPSFEQAARIRRASDGRSTSSHVAAEEHLAEVTVDEASVEKVVRDAPM